MRRIRYQVAVSLDGYIAGPNGEFDWIPADPDVDFAATFAQYDTLLMGRRTFEITVRAGRAAMPGMKTVVCSRTLDPAHHPDVTIVGDGLVQAVTELKRSPGKDIWLFGGGQLFRTLLEAGLVDTVEPAVVPVLLGGGIPFLPETSARARLALTGQRVYEKSGIVALEYAVQPRP